MKVTVENKKGLEKDLKVFVDKKQSQALWMRNMKK